MAQQTSPFYCVEKFGNFLPYIEISSNIFLFLPHLAACQVLRPCGQHRSICGWCDGDPLSGAALGPTFSRIIARQFRDLRKGDRFWYERYSPYNGFTAAQLRELRKVSLARVICDNSDDIDQIQRRVMSQVGQENPRVNCPDIPQFSLANWGRYYYHPSNNENIYL